MKITRGINKRYGNAGFGVFIPIYKDVHVLCEYAVLTQQERYLLRIGAIKIKTKKKPFYRDLIVLGYLYILLYSIIFVPIILPYYIIRIVVYEYYIKGFLSTIGLRNSGAYQDDDIHSYAIINAIATIILIGYLIKTILL